MHVYIWSNYYKKMMVFKTHLTFGCVNIIYVLSSTFPSVGLNQLKWSHYWTNRLGGWHVGLSTWAALSYMPGSPMKRPKNAWPVRNLLQQFEDG